MDLRAVMFAVRVKTAPPQLLAILLRAVVALTPGLFVLAACGGPEPPAAKTGTTATTATTQDAAAQDKSVANPAERPVPPSVSYDQHPSAGQRAPPAGPLTNPLSANSDVVQQGKMVFAAMNCDGCHGGGAVGFVGPSLIDGRWRYGGADGELFHSIYYGRAHGMPAYGGILPDTTIWQLIAYLRSEPVPGVVPTVVW